LKSKKGRKREDADRDADSAKILSIEPTDTRIEVKVR